MRAALALALLLLSAPSAGAATTLTVGAPCSVYWPGQGSQPIAVGLSGLAAGQSVRLELQVKGKTVSGLPQTTADATGSVATSLENWTSGLQDGPSRSAKARVVATDLASGTEVASTTFKVANVGVKVDSSAKAAGTKRLWLVSGLSRLGGGSTYYAYYFKGKKQVGKQRLGKGQDACGYLRVKRVLIPFKKFGTFTIRIQASPTWKGSRLPWIGGSVTSYRQYQ